MAIGAIGNAIYVNQQTATVSSLHGNQNNRFDLQNVMAQALANEKEEKVLEVRPTEDNHEVDPDYDHQRDEADRDTQRSEKKEDEQGEDIEPLHILDIKV